MEALVGLRCLAPNQNAQRGRLLFSGTGSQLSSVFGATLGLSWGGGRERWKNIQRIAPVGKELRSSGRWGKGTWARGEDMHGRDDGRTGQEVGGERVHWVGR